MTELHGDKSGKKKKKRTNNLWDIISTILNFDIVNIRGTYLHRAILEDLYLTSVLVQNSDVATLHLNLRISGVLVVIYRSVSVSVNHIYDSDDRWYYIAGEGRLIVWKACIFAIKRKIQDLAADGSVNKISVHRFKGSPAAVRSRSWIFLLIAKMQAFQLWYSSLNLWPYANVRTISIYLFCL